MKRIAFITSGGDAPGMNACIRGIVKSCLNLNIVPIAYKNGYRGMIENDFVEMSFVDVNNIIQLGGTVIGTARCKDFETKEGRRRAINNLIKNQIDGFICIGGDGSFRGAQLLAEEMNIPVVGVPGTIDNDMFGTDHTVGYDTALNTVIDAVDRIRDTASSHSRMFFVEVMGRDSGFIALNSAIASGADYVLIPEKETNVSKLISNLKGQNKGLRGSIVIVAEGDDGGGAKEIVEKITPFMSEYSLRYSILGHIQRGGRPSALDRKIATIMGVEAVNVLNSGGGDVMIGVKGDELCYTDLSVSVNRKAQPSMKNLNVINVLRTIA